MEVAANVRNGGRVEPPTFLAAIVPLLAGSVLAISGGQPLRCVTFATPGRLSAGQSFNAPIGRDLEFRLSADNRVWLIRVGPAGTMLDYLWVVSPPFQTAPHRQIGEGYSLTASQSARLSRIRRFRFVTSAEAYERAVATYERARSDPSATISLGEIEAQGDGLLELSVLGFEVVDESLKWIRIRGRACLPR